ncbi:Nucleotide-binding universal stress protein, UspA family [Halorubrum xinjiangense]|uniref:Nucleotide-binding universal stress protein, UspA family n=1 Tax=Halorubrum xinjiangense TaxID=261291 RepID=A0A1G7J1E2_9EURY|nr:universal stress protein [Halorubrum xinjiangense]SDF18777.1 Nucleotide-binding universal stress protein, UspA family [Halorubrum xinjiangense]
MTRVLVPIAVLDGGSVSPGLISLLGAVDVTVLGYHVLPEQTPPDQARLQFEERATSALEDVSQEFAAAGGAADHRLVFTHDREQTIERVTDEVDADAFAVPGTTGDVDRLLVSLSGDVDADRVLSFVEALVGDRDIGVTLFLAAGERPPAGDDDATDADTSGERDTVAVADDAVDAGDADHDRPHTTQARLAVAADRLREAGIDVETTLAAAGSPFDALVDAVPGHDAVVMGERAPSFRSFVFGEESERVAAASVGPVLVVRDRRAADEADADATPAAGE